jgi:hypothetical protein
MEVRELEEDILYQQYADIYGVNRSTLSRRWRGRTTSVDDKSFNQRKLHPHQESELVDYIGDLTKRGLASTRTKIQNFASKVAEKKVSDAWVTRFLARNNDYVISKWTSGTVSIDYATKLTPGTSILNISSSSKPRWKNIRFYRVNRTIWMKRAEKAAERERQKQARDSAKAIQLSQKGKTKASQALSTKNKRQKQGGGGAATAEGESACIEPPPKVTSRGRSMRVSQIFR